MALAGMITGMNQAQDSLVCAAYLMGQYRPTEEDDKDIRARSISVFNREAKGVAKVDHFVLAEDEQAYSVGVHDWENFQYTRMIIRGPKIELTDAQTEVIRVAFKAWEKAPIQPSELLYQSVGKGQALPIKATP